MHSVDVRLGNLGGHTVLDNRGLPVPDPSFLIFAKVGFNLAFVCKS
jgi:hypothetical protein